MSRFNVVKIKARMLELGLTVAVAESLTCGNIQASLGSISGASDFFEGGITAYSLRQKVEILGVEREHAAQVNCVSVNVADQMASSICTKFDTTLGLSTTGYAEPNDQIGVAEPYAHFSICYRNRDRDTLPSVVSQGIIRGPGFDRNQIQTYVTSRVLEELVKYLDSLAAKNQS